MISCLPSSVLVDWNYRLLVLHSFFPGCCWSMDIRDENKDYFMFSLCNIDTNKAIFLSRNGLFSSPFTIDWETSNYIIKKTMICGVTNWMPRWRGAIMLFWVFAHPLIIPVTFSSNNHRCNSLSWEKKNTYLGEDQPPSSKNPGKSHDATEQKYLFVILEWRQHSSVLFNPFWNLKVEGQMCCNSAKKNIDSLRLYVHDQFHKK